MVPPRCAVVSEMGETPSDLRHDFGCTRQRQCPQRSLPEPSPMVLVKIPEPTSTSDGWPNSTSSEAFLRYLVLGGVVQKPMRPSKAFHNARGTKETYLVSSGEQEESGPQWCSHSIGVMTDDCLSRYSSHSCRIANENDDVIEVGVSQGRGEVGQTSEICETLEPEASPTSRVSDSLQQKQGLALHSSLGLRVCCKLLLFE